MKEALSWLYVLLFFIPISVQVSAQSVATDHHLKRELLFRYDNDFIYKTDRYYTSGLDIIYSRLIDPNSTFYQLFRSRKSDSLKVITQYNYGHKIFTPNGIIQKDVADFDRPYAGWHYLKFGVKNFSSVSTMNTFLIEIGLIGEASGMGDFQKWWHSSVGISKPAGWQYQISNELVINLTYSQMKSWKVMKLLDLVTDTSIKLGNGQNRLSQDITLRFGKFNRLVNSGYSGSRVASKIRNGRGNDREATEIFLFYGITAEHIISNILIQGSLFNDNSSHTEEIEKNVLSRRLGLMYTNYYTTFYITLYRLSPEVIGGKTHRFINFNVAFRF